MSSWNLQRHQIWFVETALDELKTHLRGARIVLRSKTPELVRQEAYGLLLAHFAIRGLMHEAALKGDVDADQLSFLHSVHVVKLGFLPSRQADIQITYNTHRLPGVRKNVVCLRVRR